MRRRRIGARDSGILLTALMIGCSPQPPPEKKPPLPAGKPAAQITQFYARDPILPRGEKTVLCYGVANAKSLRLSPPVDKVWPAFTRCIDAAPVKDTTYTLAAVGDDGKEVSQSVTVQIGPPLPKILEVSVNSLNVHASEQVTICYKVKNAASVNVKPGWPLALNLRVIAAGQGCFGDKPVKTTTYTVTAYGAEGLTDTERVTVNVK